MEDKLGMQGVVAELEAAAAADSPRVKQERDRWLYISDT